MKKSMKAAVAIAGAAVVVVGGTAFTNSNTGMPANAYAGTGSTTVSGVAITNAVYSYDATVATDLEQIAWTTTNTVPNAKYTITSALTTGSSVNGTCVSDGAEDASVITCTYADTPVQTITAVSLTVIMKDDA